MNPLSYEVNSEKICSQSEYSSALYNYKDKKDRRMVNRRSIAYNSKPYLKRITPAV